MSLMARAKSVVRKSQVLRAGAYLMENVVAAVRPPQVRVPAASTKYRLASFVRVKNEGRFLPEWIAHNIVLGVEHFYIYDNGSGDGTAEILKPFVEAGHVTLIDWPERPIYPSADIHFLTNYGGLCEWVMIFDPDEFVAEASSGALLSALEARASAPALAINWRYFGSSGHDRMPEGLLIENFTQCDGDVDVHVKVIVRSESVRSLRNPHNLFFTRGRLARTAEGTRAFGSFAQPRGDALVLNHYVYRSREDYTRKATQGFADKKKHGEVPRSIERIESEFPKHNASERRFSEAHLARVREVLKTAGYGAPYVE